ncbi:MAG: 30S ribosomal protein S20 [Candidatus Brocadiae bacterium]|nr:30S ribosomal protein S20 [Candidatus Brocadiia bacterium]
MAHSRSNKKRVRQNEARRLRNHDVKARFRSQIKKVLKLAKAKGEGLEKEMNQLISWLDKAAVKKVIHRNTAARYKGRITVRVKALKAGAKA